MDIALSFAINRMEQMAWSVYSQAVLDGTMLPRLGQTGPPYIWGFREPLDYPPLPGIASVRFLESER